MADTIVFSEDVGESGGFPTFLSYKPVNGATLNNRHFTFMTNEFGAIGGTGMPWESNITEDSTQVTWVNRGSLFNDEPGTEVTILLNEEPSSNKNLKVLGFEGGGSWSVDIASDIESKITDTTTIPITRSTVGTIQGTDWVNREGKFKSRVYGVERDQTNLDVQAFSVEGIGISEFIPEESVRNVGVLDENISDVTQNIGIDGPAQFVRNIIDLSTAIQTDDTYGFQNSETTEAMAFGINGPAQFDDLELDQSQALDDSQAEYVLRVGGIEYHASVFGGSIRFLRVGSPLNNDTRISFKIFDNSGVEVLSVENNFTYLLSSNPLGDVGYVSDYVLTDDEFNALVGVSSETLGNNYLIDDENLQIYEGETFPQSSFGIYHAYVFDGAVDNILHVSKEDDVVASVGDSVSVVINAERGSGTFEGGVISSIRTDTLLPGGDVLGISFTQEQINQIESIGSISISGDQAREYFTASEIELFISSSIPTNPIGPLYTSYAIDEEAVNYLFVTSPLSGTFTDGDLASVVVSGATDSIRIESSNVFNIANDPTLGGPAVRFTLTEPEVDLVQTLGVRENPGNRLQTLFQNEQITLFDDTDVPLTDRGDTFKAAVAEDLMFVFSKTSGTTINNGDVISININGVFLEGLIVTDNVSERDNIAGGEAVTVLITQAQFDSVIPFGNLIEGVYYFTTIEVEVYQDQRVPLVRRGISEEGFAFSYYINEDIGGGVRNQLRFLINEDHSINVGDAISFKFWNASPFPDANGNTVRDPLDLDPFELENLTVDEIFFDNTFGETVGISYLSQAQVELVRGASILNLNVNSALTDTNGEEVTDTDGNVIEDDRPATIRYHFLTVQVDVYLQPTVPFDLIISHETPSVQIQPGDKLFYYVTNDDGTLSQEVRLAGSIRDVVGNNIEFIQEGQFEPVSGDFFLYSKNQEYEESGISGYFHEITFKTNDNTEAELFAINAEIFELSK